MSDIKWKLSGRATNPVDLLTTELNSLATTGSAISAAISNDQSGERDLYADFELLIDYGTGPTANTVIELYIVRSVDAGSNFEDGSTTGPVVPANGLVGSFKLRNTTDTQRIILPGITIPPGDFKVMVWARTTGQTAQASGNVLRALFYKEEAA